MFGVALSINRRNFISIIERPKAVITGVISQFILLPILTFLLVWIIDPMPGLALGMILVASCPGGNVSNFFSTVANGNIALSVTLTAIATLGATFMTPLNFDFWGSMLPSNVGINAIEINFWQLFQTVVITLAIPLLLGLGFAYRFPKTTEIVKKPIRVFSFIILVGFIVFAFYANVHIFMEYIHHVILLVFLHNALALLLGYYFGRLTGCEKQDCRTISIETGIQNSALGLLVIFTLFDGHGGMAIVTAWWGVWHIISGLIVSTYFNYKSKTSLTIGS